MLQSKEEVCRPLLLLHTTAYYFLLLHSTAYLCILLTLLQSREQERPSYCYIRQHSSDTTAFSCILLDIAAYCYILLHTTDTTVVKGAGVPLILLHTAAFYCRQSSRRAYYCILHTTVYYCILLHPTAYY